MSVIPKVTQYKYIKDNSRIYCICTSKPTTFREHVFYTEPYYIKERKELRNAIMGYTNPEIAESKLKIMKHIPESSNIHSMVLDDLKCISSIMMMPLLVEAGNYCDITEKIEMTDVYYYFSEEYISAKKMLKSKHRNA